MLAVIVLLMVVFVICRQLTVKLQRRHAMPKVGMCNNDCVMLHLKNYTSFIL